MPGKTTQTDVKARLGMAPETVSDPDSGDEVWVYNSNLEVPLLVSLIPVAGDIADLIELVYTTQKKRELIVLFDKQGVVRKYELRELE